ncbi:MAG: FIST C-terminal domain-containing protein [Rhodobacter sp.]|uniref:FIST N-terminal domain-containing protein n=1 Tax=Pararhodobacter sp. TaxID=2127056 RepID=UPI001DD611F6|nr:FIST N-terminal domain-containing protein [Pararhodobacter sp.]MCB1345781.1 FIST C-terminal domain-containing protein [Paracoccaceae bacterium]MCC0073970.1 FIST C-terminal domain-containing protein [Rhodobacter sp.]HPD91320.1 FIST N-terminal domain-containing protein [Pararhodobacter sp.]
MDEPLIRTAEVSATDPDAAAALAAALGPGPFALVVIFASPRVPDLAALVRALTDRLAPIPVIGCTTAGEIGAQGYAEGLIVATALPAQHFRAEILTIPDLGGFDTQAVIGDLIRARTTLARLVPRWDHDFVFLLVDGLSAREDALASTLAPGLGATPLFGGSAADGTRFLETFVFSDGRALRNAAVAAVVRTDCPVRVFKFDHFRPTGRRMVVTGADPSRRVVHTINAEPAAREYARLLGKDPAQLTPFTFAAHPVVVRIGGRHHVRSIRQVDEQTGDLIFFSAIDDGLVLTLAEAEDMTDHLGRALADIAGTRAPAAILACDCVLRRMEAQEKQLSGHISALFRAHRVTGFSTYGEQLNGMHVNQTLTGVALYPPPAATPDPA